MKELNYNRKGVTYSPIKHWRTDSVTNIAIYQGSRGTRPELDFIVKYKEEGKRLRTPSHTHWIVDLLLKSESSPDRVCQFIKEWIEIYDVAEPFQSTEERKNYELIYNQYFLENYWDLENIGSFSVEFLSGMIELFIKCEKRTENAFMFKTLLNLIKEYCEGKKDFYQVISYSKRV